MITTVDELSSVLANVTPTAAAAGVSFEEVAASIAVMTASGTPAAQATTQLNAAIGAFVTPNTNMVKSMKSTVTEMVKSEKLTGKFADAYDNLQDEIEATTKELDNLDPNMDDYDKQAKALTTKISDLSDAQDEYTGALIGQIVEVEGLQGALMLLEEATDGNADATGKALGSTEAYKALLATTGDNAESFNEVLMSMADTTGLVDDAFEKVTDTTEANLNQTLNKLKNILIEVSGVLLEVVNIGLDFINFLLSGSDAVGLLAIALGTVTALVVAYQIQLVAAAAGTTAWGVVAAAATTVTSALATAFAFLTSPIGLVILAIGAVIAVGYLLVKNWDEIISWLSETMTAFFEFWSEIWTAISDFFKEIWESMSEFFIELWESIVEFITETLNYIQEFINMVFTAIYNFFVFILTSIKDFFVNIWESIKEFTSSIFSTISDIFTNTWTAISDFFTSTIENIRDMFVSVFTFIKDFITDILDAVFDVVLSRVEFIIDTFKLLLEFLKNVFTLQWSDAWENVKDIFKNVLNAIPTIALTPFNALINLVNSLLKQLNKIQIPEWVPGFGGKGLNFPMIDNVELKLASGGLAYGETAAIVGDNIGSNVNPEVIAPLDQLQGMISEEIIRTSNYNGGEISVTVVSELDGEVLAKSVLTNLDEELSYM